MKWGERLRIVISVRLLSGWLKHKHCDTMTVDLISDAIKSLTGVGAGTGNMFSMKTLNKGIIHILCRMEQDSTRFHHVIQSSVQFKTNKLFISFWNLPFNIFELQLTSGTETMKIEIVDKGDGGGANILGISCWFSPLWPSNHPFDV